MWIKKEFDFKKSTKMKDGKEKKRKAKKKV